VDEEDTPSVEAPALAAEDAVADSTMKDRGN
jgi:hypothetical protein